MLVPSRVIALMLTAPLVQVFFLERVLRYLNTEPYSSWVGSYMEYWGFILKPLPSRELTYPTLGKGKSSSKCHFGGIC